MILFLSQYPKNEVDLKDGMMQRIMHIDNFFSKEERVYLNVSLKNIKKKKITLQDSLITVIDCHYLFHFFTILNLFTKSKLIYIHSVFNVLPSFIGILFKKKKKYAIDLHGVVPEEVLLSSGSKLKFKLFTICESLIFKRASTAICVTNAMREHFCLKYPSSSVNYITYAILPDNILHSRIETSPINSKVTIIYSGNIQKWQNINLMCDVIAENLDKNYDFLILTGNLTGMIAEFEKKGIYPHRDIKILSVHPNELNLYYEKSNYGFILRDDIVVNNVACPTKVIEYLNYGITPIVISSNIGDFLELGYDYIQYNDLDKKLLPVKSEKNRKIIELLISHNNKVNLNELIIEKVN